MAMRDRFRLYRQGGVFYAQDNQSDKQESLRTTSRKEALQLLRARNESYHTPLMSLALGKVYLAAHNPTLLTRTWAEVMDEMIRTATHPASRRRVLELLGDVARLNRVRRVIYEHWQANNSLRAKDGFTREA